MLAVLFCASVSGEPRSCLSGCGNKLLTHLGPGLNIRRMKTLRRGTAVGVALCVVAGLTTGCGGGAQQSGAESIQQLADDIGLKEAGWASVSTGGQVWLRHVKDGKWHTETLSDGKAEDQGPEAADMGYRVVPLADLKVDELDKLVEEYSDKCEGGVSASAASTPGGALVQSVDCLNEMKNVTTFLDGKELKPNKEWDAATVERTLTELASALPEQITGFKLTTPNSIALGAGYSAMGEALIDGVDGKQCYYSISRFAKPEENLGYMSGGDCKPAEGGGETFAVNELDFKKTAEALVPHLKTATDVYILPEGGKIIARVQDGAVVTNTIPLNE